MTCAYAWGNVQVCLLAVVNLSYGQVDLRVDLNERRLRQFD